MERLAKFSKAPTFSGVKIRSNARKNRKVLYRVLLAFLTANLYAVLFLPADLSACLKAFLALLILFRAFLCSLFLLFATACALLFALLAGRFLDDFLEPFLLEDRLVLLERFRFEAIIAQPD